MADELTSITNDYFMLENGKASDIYFKTSFLLNYLMKQQKGLFLRPGGGMKIRVPLEYDGQEAAFFTKGDVLNSDDRESLTAAYFDWKHAYGNATVYLVDLLKNSGDEQKVELVTQRVGGAQKSLTSLLASSIYDGIVPSSNRLTGLLACCNASTAVAYGEIAEASLIAADGSYPWKGRVTTTAEGLSLAVLRTMITSAHVRDGEGGDPGLFVTTRTLFDVLSDLLQIQQRFTGSDEAAKAGFKGMSVNGVEVFPDDYCPSGYAFALNPNHIGFAIHKKGMFVRNDWTIIEGSPGDKTMKILWHGNMVCNNRKAHIAHSNLS